MNPTARRRRVVGLDLSSEPVRSTGVGRYAVALCRALAELDPPDVRFVAFGPRGLGLQEVPGLEVVATPFGEGRSAARRAFQQTALPALARARGVELLHSVNNLPPLGWPESLVLTFQDAKLYRAAAGAPLPRRFYRRSMHRWGARRARRVLVASEYSKREAVRALGVAPHRVRVVPFGVEAERFAPSEATERSDPAVLARHHLNSGTYVLSVATREPAKNLPRVLRAFASLASRRSDIELVLCGGRGWGGDDLEALSARLGIAQRVRFLGYVADEDLPALYRSARAFLFPSLVEGFGLPILEAMAAGTPVVTSTATACPETAGGAAVLVDPADVVDIARGLAEALEPERAADLRARGLARASQCTWRRCAEGTLACYREAIAERSGGGRRVHVTSLLSPAGFYDGAEGGASRDRALVEHLGRVPGARVHYLARDRRYPLRLARFLYALARERGACFYLQYPRLPATLRTRGLPRRLLREAFLLALRRAAARNRVLVDVSDLPVEQAESLGLELPRDEAQAFREFEASLAELPVETVFAAEAMARYAQRARGLDPARGRIALNGAPRASVRSAEAGERTPATLRLVYAGTLRRGCGLEELLDAFAAVRRPAQLVLLGSDGEWLRGALDERVRLVGGREEAEAHRLAGACHLGLVPYDPSLPYLRLVYPIKASFYWSAGLPVLSTPLPEVEARIASGAAGRCLPLSEWPAWIDALGAEELAALEAQARARAADFTWERTLADLLASLGGPARGANRTTRRVPPRAADGA